MAESKVWTLSSGSLPTRWGGVSERSRDIAFGATLVAAAVTLGLLEATIAPPMPLPWARLGLANAAVLVALGMYGPRSAALVGVSKLFLVGLLTGALVGPGSLMGLAGTAAAIAAMSAATYLRGLSAVGWSAAGAIAHIVAQFGIAAVLTGTPVVWALLPISMCVSLAFGVAVGLLARTLLSHLPRAGFAIR